MALWLASITVDVYIIINHVMGYCLLLVTQPTKELLLCQGFVLAQCGRFPAFVPFCTCGGSERCKYIEVVIGI